MAEPGRMVSQDGGAGMDQDGRTGPPGRMVSQNGGPRWVRMGRWESREGRLARTEGQDRPGWADGRAGQHR